MPIYTPFLVGDFDPKVGQTDLAFGVQSGIINRSYNTYMQDYNAACSSYDLCHPG